MTESVAVAKEADVKKGVSPTKSDNSIHRVRDEADGQLGALRGVVGNITRNGGTPSVDSIATHLSGMQAVQRAPVLLGLQRTHGNRYVQRVVTGIQAKLVVGQPGDKYEQEADRVAEAVMRMPEPQVQRQVGEEELIQAKSRGDVTPEVTHDLESQINTIRGGKPLSESERAFFEPRFGVNFGQVRVHTDIKADSAAQSVNALAFTVGNNIVFRHGKYAPHNNDGRRLLAHELAHVASPSHVGLMRRVTPDYNQIEDAFSYGFFVTDADVQNVLDILSSLNATDIADTLAEMRIDGYIDLLIDNISNADLIAFLQQVQRTGATTFAAGKGLASQADMAQAQATFMQARNTAAAAAMHGPAPTAAQTSAQHSSSVASTSIAPQTGTLSVADERTQNAAATAAVATFITWVQANRPSLNITASDIRVDSRAIFDRGLSIIAFADAGKAVVGPSFTRAVNADPAYALPTIIHELRGHEQYGPYGQPGSEYNLEIYDQAAALMPNYTQPTGAGRSSEIDAYAYQETEIYALLIEVPYYTPVTPAHSALASVNYDPAPTVSYRIDLIKTQFESRVAQSLLRGLWMRLRLDPRLQPQALQVFEQGIHNNFTAAEATAILQ